MIYEIGLDYLQGDSKSWCDEIGNPWHLYKDYSHDKSASSFTLDRHHHIFIRYTSLPCLYIFNYWSVSSIYIHIVLGQLGFSVGSSHCSFY